MPTILTHAALPFAAGIALGRRHVPPRLVLAGMAAAMLPDADVAMFAVGVDYAHAFGHRGASHSLVFALASGLLAAGFARLIGTSRRIAFLFITLSTASHPLLDMLTDGGLGVALLWPWTEGRYFAPWRVVEVSPFAHRFFSTRGIEVLCSEVRWIMGPALVVAATSALARRALRAPARQRVPRRDPG